MKKILLLILMLLALSSDVLAVSGQVEKSAVGDVENITINNIAEIGDALRLSSLVEAYVSPTGSDSNNDCLTALTPCATINHGLAEIARYVSPVTKKLNLLPGTYTEQVVIPTHLLGSIKIQGTTLDPDDVIITSGSISTDAITNLIGNEASWVTLDHLTIQNSANAVAIQGQNMGIGHVKFDHNRKAISASDMSMVVFYDGGVGHMASIVGNDSLSYSYGIQAYRACSVVIQNGIDISNVTVGIFINDRSYLGMSGAVPLNITMSNTVGRYAGILLRSGSFGFFAGALAIDGFATSGSNLGVQVSGSTLSFSAGLPASTSFTNLHYGFMGTGITNITSGNESVVYNYDASVTIPAYIQHSVVLDTADALDTIVTWFADFGSSFASYYGYDERYTQFSTTENYYVNGGTGSDTACDGSVGCPYKTIQKAVTRGARHLCSDAVNVYIADGTYIEDVDIPPTYVGTMKFHGNATTPDNVIWKSSGVDYTLNSAASNQSIYVDGVKFQDNVTGRAISINGGELHVGYVKFYNNLTAIYAYSGTVEFMSGYTAPTIDGNDLHYSTGIYAFSGSYFRTENSFTITNIDTGISIGSGSVGYLGVGNTYAIDLTTDWTNTIGLHVYNNSIMQTYGSLTVDGVSALAGSVGLRMSERSTFYATSPSDVLLFKNLDYGLSVESGCTFGGAAATFTYAGNTHDNSITYDTTIDTINLGPISWASAGITYGYDQRYDQIISDIADGATAVGHSYDTAVEYVTSGAKLASWANHGSEKAYISKDGLIGAGGLHLPSGGVIGWLNLDVTITHSANALTIDGGRLILGDDTIAPNKPALSVRMPTGGYGGSYKNTVLMAGDQSDAATLYNNVNMGLMQEASTVDNYAFFNFYNASYIDVATFGVQYKEHGAIGSNEGDFFIATAKDALPVIHQKVTADGTVAIGESVDLDGTPSIGKLVVKATTSNGSTNAVAFRDATDANIATLDSDGALSLNDTLTVGSGASYGGGAVEDVATVQTTDETVTDLASVALAEGDVVSVEITIIARKSDGSQRALYRLIGIFYRNASGNVTLQGDIVSINTVESDAAWDCALVADTANQTVDVRVVGVAATTINWKADVKVLKVQ